MKTNSNILPASILTKSQTITRRAVKGKKTLFVTIRYDDRCGNGHNTFAITGSLYNGIHETPPKSERQLESCGCIHDTIAKFCPDLKPFLKWHLVSSDGPLHYISGTTYHADDRDYNGLREGETGKLCWKLEKADHSENLPQYVDSDERPVGSVTYVYKPLSHIGKGKARELAAARGCAVWPEATDEQLCLPKEELTALLTARLPALMAEFKKDMESLGFVY